MQDIWERLRDLAARLRWDLSALDAVMVHDKGAVVKAGTLDDRSEVRPTVEVWCVDRQPWVELPGMVASLDRG